MGLFDSLRNLFFRRMARSGEGYSVKNCWGAVGCPFSLTPMGDLLQRTEEVLKEERITEFLREKTGGTLLKHHEFKVWFAECPNGCSQIYIADIALHAFAEMEVRGERCTSCGRCVRACEEGAIRLEGGRAVIDSEKCLGCGICEKACPEGAIKRKAVSYKMYVGGKLGRRPRLATYHRTLYSPEEVVEEVRKVVRFYKEKNRKGERLGTILQREGTSAELGKSETRGS